MMPATMALVHNLLNYDGIDLSINGLLDRISDNFSDWDLKGAPEGKDDFYSLLNNKHYILLPGNSMQDKLVLKDLYEVIMDDNISPEVFSIDIDYVLDRISIIEDSEKIAEALIRIDEILSHIENFRNLKQLNYASSRVSKLMSTLNIRKSKNTVQEENLLNAAQDNAEIMRQIEKQQTRIKKLEEENATLTQENKELRNIKNNLNEWYSGTDYIKISEEEEMSVREKLVFFTTALSIENNKKYTVLSNLATFIETMCKGPTDYLGPMISKMKKPEYAEANAKAAKKVAGLLLKILPKEYRNDQRLTINKLIESMKANYPEND